MKPEKSKIFSSRIAPFAQILLPAITCFTLLFLAKIQLLLSASGNMKRLLTCFLWGIPYEIAIASFLSAILCLVTVCIGSGRRIAIASGVVLTTIQIFEVSNLLFYRFFGYHLDLKLREYSSVTNTLHIKDSILNLFQIRDIAFSLVAPFALIAISLIFVLNFSRKPTEITRNRILLSIAIALTVGVSANYIGNIAPGNVTHDTSGLSQEPIFLLAQQAAREQIKSRTAQMNVSLPEEEWSRFKAFYNLSKQQVQLSEKYPWMRGRLNPMNKTPVGKRKNVVFIFLESFGAMSVTPLSPVFNATTPEIARLSQQGVLFRRAYYNTNPTAPAESSVLCSVYSNSSILEDLQTHLDCAGDIMSRNGYFTNFIAGNSLNYDNQYEFWRAHGFRSIIDEGSFWFPPSRPQVPGHWGKYVDGDVFKEAAEWIKENGSKPWPFFLVIKTASSHAPYPDMGEQFHSNEGVDTNQRRMNGSMKYVDHELGKFINQLSTYPHYKDTIFFIFGDHAPNEIQQWPSRADFNTFVAHSWIPLLILNPVGLQTGKKIDWVVSQVDLLPTMLDMVGISTDGAFAGNSLIDPNIAPEHRYAYVLDRARGRRGIINSRYAFSWNYRLRRTKLFDLKAAPFSRIDVSKKHPDVAQKYEQWIKSFEYVSRWTFEHDRFIQEKAVTLKAEQSNNSASRGSAILMRD